jgi:hypothetical protein
MKLFIFPAQFYLSVNFYTVAEYLTMWGVADIVREGIKTAKYAPGHTIGAQLFR